jgi:hypothetical protein
MLNRKYRIVCDNCGKFIAIQDLVDETATHQYQVHQHADLPLLNLRLAGINIRNHMT